MENNRTSSGQPAGLTGELLDDDAPLTLVQLCRICQVSTESVLALIDQGAVEPVGRVRTQWKFQTHTVRRVRLAARLQRDLGVNAAGVALVIDLMDEIERARDRLTYLEKQLRSGSGANNGG